MEPSDPFAASRAAKKQAEEMQAAILKKARLESFKKHQDGSYGMRKDIGKSNQVVIPAKIVRRWGGIGASVIVLDLDWAVLVVPEGEARILFKDLKL